ncbi:MAG: hypothetical protein RL042_2161 [Nitrospirota bacterium]
MVTHPSILLIEDSPGECELFRLALAQTGLAVMLHTEQGADASLQLLNDLTTCAHGYSQGEAAGMVSTARVERGPSQAARSASTETMPAASPPSRPGPLVARAQKTDQAALPSLILLDLNLCGQNGCDFLKRLRSDARLAAIPVVIFTTSDDPADLAHCYSCGANGYVVKPGTFDELVHCIGDLCRYWLTWNRSMVNPEC